MRRQNVITKRGLAKILREIEWLQKVERPKITAEVSFAASLGDRSENAEYIYGKKRLREIDRRMRYLIGRLDHVVEVDTAAQATNAGDTIAFGATVDIVDADGNERTYRIYGEAEVAIDRGVLSWKSPIAKAMLGKEEGDEVTYRAPGGERTIEIVEVRYEAQEPLPEGDLEAWRLP